VFSCGNCQYGSHGHGRSNMVRLPQLIAELCGNRVATGVILPRLTLQCRCVCGQGVLWGRAHCSPCP
jgi:hypothetical protein